MLSDKFDVRRWAWPLAIMLALAGCGGGGSGGATGNAASLAGSAAAGGPTAAVRLKLVADSVVLSSDGKTPVNVSAIATDANGLAVAGAPVALVVRDPSDGTRLQVTQAKTDATGTATAVLSLLAGSPSNRPVVVSAQVGPAAADTLEIRVSGTTLAVSGPSSLLYNGAAARFTATLHDAAGNPLAGQPVAVKSMAGNRLSAASATTDASGQAVVDVSGTVAGADTIQFSAAGAAAGAQITVAGDNLTISPVQPAAGGLPIRKSQRAPATFTVTYAKAGGIALGTQVALATTRGTVTPAVADLSGNGSVSFTVESDFAGPATLTASVGGVTASFGVDFIATDPAGVDLQSSPTTVGLNADGAGTNRTLLVATVRDADGNPVANRDVAFNAIADPSGGTITPGIARTDPSGRATAAFIPGPRTTPTNGVRIRATDIAKSIASQEALVTVSNQALFVRMGTNRTLDTSISDASYRKNFDVIVTDATGNAVPNATVQAQVRSIGYAIGNYVPGSGSWEPAYRSYAASDFAGNALVADPAAARDALNARLQFFNDGASYRFDGVVRSGLPYYVSEDADNDGVCKAGEDVNFDGQLTPGNVASVPSKVTTDEYGRATVGLVYPRSLANWVIVRVEVTIRVNGSEGTAGFTYPLQAVASDLDPTLAPPGGVNSPFPFRTDRRTCP